MKNLRVRSGGPMLLKKDGVPPHFRLPNAGASSERRSRVREPWERKGALSGKGLPFQPVYPAVRRKLFTARRAREPWRG